MKDKKKVVFLLVAVAGIWGVIGWKIYEALIDDDKVAYDFVVSKGKPVELPTYDDYNLMLDYKDPFTGKVVRKKKTVNPGKRKRQSIPKKTTEKAPKKLANWNAIKYHGVVVNAKTKQRTASFIIHGKDYILNVGEEAGGFRLDEILGDSVKVSSEGLSDYVRIEGF